MQLPLSLASWVSKQPPCIHTFHGTHTPKLENVQHEMQEAVHEHLLEQDATAEQVTRLEQEERHAELEHGANSNQATSSMQPQPLSNEQDVATG